MATVVVFPRNPLYLALLAGSGGANGPTDGPTEGPTEGPGGEPPGPSPILFDAPLQTSLIPNFAGGDPTPTFTRTSTATFYDFEGLVRTAQEGESRFHGARRVENLAIQSDDFTLESGVWTPGSSGTGAGKLITFDATNSAEARIFTPVELPAGSDVRITINFTAADAGKEIRLGIFTGAWDYGSSIAIPDSGERVSRLIENIPAALQFVGVVRDANYQTGSVTVLEGILVENVTGQADQSPSEHVSTRVESAPYHGANIDGVQYFNTDRQGNPLDATDFGCDAKGAYGYISESSSTNQNTYSEDFTQAAWAKVRSMVEAHTDPAPDGTPSQKLVADTASGSHYITQNIGSFTNGVAYTASLYVKAKEVEDIQIQIRNTDNTYQYAKYDLATGTLGTVTADEAGIEALPNGWYRCWLTDANVGSGVTVPRMEVFLLSPTGATAWPGNDIDGALYWGAQLEVGAHASSYIPTAGSTVTRAADLLTYDDVGNIEDAAGTASAEVATYWANASSPGVYVISRGTSARPFYLNVSVAPTSAYAFDGANASTAPNGANCYLSPKLGGATWGDQLTAFYDGTPDPTPANYSGNWGSGDLCFGARVDGSRQWNGTVRGVTITNEEETP